MWELAVFKFKKSQLKLFWKMMNERHRIYIKKKSGAPWPWTKDKILREYKFTNVFRQLDRVTEDWSQRYRTILARGKGMARGDLLFHCAMFRLFNWPPTYDALYYDMGRWNLKKAMKILEAREKEGHKIFTGAYIVPNTGRTDPKIQVICEALQYLYERRKSMESKIKRKKTSIQRTVEILKEVPTIGDFIGYEIACDLRHTRLLSHARDINSWANPGPGARRGINRLLTTFAKPKGKKPDYIKAMRQLLVEAKAGAFQWHKGTKDWPFEMREIEHTLCEYDKYMRVKNGEGRPRSKYRPPENIPV